MSDYWPIILQQRIENSELEQLSKSDISDLEKCIGQKIPLMIPFMKASLMWPFWTGAMKYVSWVPFVLYILVFISTLIYLAELISNESDTNLVSELCLQFLVLCFFIFVMYFVTLNKRNSLLIREVLVLMSRNFFRCSFEEKEILHNYTKTANFASYIITGLICCSYNMYFIIISVLVPVTANLILPGNYTYEKKLSLHFELYTCTYIAQVFISSLGISYTLTVAFVTAKFRFLGFKLKQILILSQTQDFLEENDDIFKNISQLVRLHQYCIHFFELLNKLTSPVLVLGILNVIIGCSISGCLMVIKYKEDIHFFLKMIFAYILCAEFLLVVSFPSQMISDASSDIFEDCYSTDWFKYSIKNRKMIQLIMMRSIRPSCIKIGPSKYLNYATSRQIIQLSLSYFISLLSIYDP